MGTKVVRLADCCTIRPPKSEAKKKLTGKDNVSFVPMNNLGIGSKRLVLDKDLPISEVSGSYTYFGENDVLMAKITPCFENGKLGIARGLTNGVGFGSSEFIVLRPNDELIPDYLYYYLLRPEFREAGEKVMTGAVGHKRVPKEYVENAQILLPPTTEQKRIVSILDKAFEAIDEAKAKTEQNLKNAHEIFDSYLQQVFSQRGEGWVEKKLSECFKLRSGVGLTKKNMLVGPYPVYGGNGIAGHHNDYNLDQNSVIIGRVGALCGNARFINEKIWLTDNAFLVKDFKFDFDLEFLTYLLNFKDLRNLARQAAQPVISNSSLSKLTIEFPLDVHKQCEIKDSLDLLQLELNSVSKVYEQKIALLNELKNSLLQKAFSGELSAKQAEEAVA
ncbi:hypothetical protein BM527_01120 [Alteromonas sp. Mex14]|nr:hypothetical protein BM527_01120 [Alteromonas sp. Mex14]